DIPDLVEHFIHKHAPPPRAVRLSEELRRRLTEYDWPGNVRELENVIRRILVLSSGPVAGVELLEGRELVDKKTAPAGFPTEGVTLRDMEKQLLRGRSRPRGEIERAPPK